MSVRSLIVAIVVVLAGLVLASPAQAYPTMPQGIQGPFTVPSSRLSTATRSMWTPTVSASRFG